jgi:hypothetical protein
LPAIQNIIFPHGVGNTLTFQRPNNLNSFIEGSRNRWQKNLTQEWERVNTPEGRARLIDDLLVLQDRIESIIDQYIRNRALNV